MHPTLTVLVGLPGSGKTNFRGLGNFIYSTDDELEKMAKYTHKTYDEVWKDFFKMAKRNADLRLKEAYRDRLNITHDQTNLSVKKRKSILENAPKDYVKRCIYILPPRDGKEARTLKNRLENRPGKTIPQDVLDSMWKRMEHPTISEDFDSITIVDIFGNEIGAIHK